MRHSKVLASLLVGMGWTAVIGGVAILLSWPWLGIALVILGWLLIIAGVVVWRRGEPDTPLDRLRNLMARAIDLRTYVLMEGAGAYENDEGEVVGGDPYPISQDEPLYKWAREAWEAVREDFPVYANEFYGEDYKLGPAHLMLSYAQEVNRDGRGDYLERRIALLKRVIERASSVPQR